MATTFPQSIQTFPDMLDISSEDAAQVVAYQTAVQNGDTQAAQTALNNIANANQKLVTADLLNTLLDTMGAVQEYFLERYSPAYVVSETEPAAQQTGDFWFKVIT